MTKRFISFVLILLTVSLSFAELASSNRYFELGMEVEAGASNNYFAAGDVLTKKLVLDLTKMAEDLNDSGLEFDFAGKEKNYLAVNAGKNFRLQLFWGLEGSGYGNISKDLFDMLGKGFSANSSKNIELAMYGDIFADAGISFKTDIKGFGVRFTPSVFAPLVHVAQTNAKITYKSTDAGLIRAEADVPVNIYSVVSLENMSDQEINAGYIQDVLGQMVSNLGFDFGFEIEHQITKTFEMGVFTRFPVVPGHLSYKASTRYWGVFEQNNLLGVLDETNSNTKDYGHDEFVYSRSGISVNRPMVFGVEGAWRPFGNWNVFRPKLNLAVRNPFTADYQVYGEYSLLADFTFLKVIGLRFGTAFENLIYKHTLGFMINARVVEVDAGVMFRGGDFVKSFDLTGAGAYAALKIGF